MSSTWMPRAATSVATSASTLPSENRCEVPGAAGLVQVAVQALGPHALAVELVGELLGERPGAREHERAVDGAQQRAAAPCSFSPCSISEHAMVAITPPSLSATSWTAGSGRNSSTSGGDRRVEGRREEQPLPGPRDQAQEPLHRLEEAEVGHVVGLVEHGDLDLRRGRGGAGRCRSSMRPGVPMTMSTPFDERTHLAGLRHAADDLRREEADGAGDRLHRAVDLERELAGRREDQRARSAAHPATGAGASGLVPVAHQPLDERCAEGDGLAAARAPAAEHVAPRERVGDGRGLDGERRRRRRGRRAPS